MKKEMIWIGLAFALFGVGPAIAEELSIGGIMAELEKSMDPANRTAGVPPAAPAEPLDAAALQEKSREQFVAGDYEQAEAGFKKVLDADPENAMATLYLQQIDKNLHRNIEEAAISAVDGEWDSSLQLRYYEIDGQTLKSMGLSGLGEPLHVEGKFPFVTFAEGASAIYRPNLQKLFVRNDVENLEMVENILANLGLAGKAAGDDQVKIEARFVEFSEGALEELGFNWSNPEAIDLSDDWELPADQDIFSDALHTVPFDKTGKLGPGEIPATGNWRANRLEDMFSAEAGTLAFSGEIGSDPLDLLIRSLDQTSGADVLSAPSIVTLSGEKAVIKVGERHNYPMEYIEGVSVGTVLHVMYEGWEEKILGVEMDVTPTINGEEINLLINPKITELIGWERFQLAAADTSYTYASFRIGQQFEHEPVMAKLPVFKRREIKTEISVDSGSTVAMGGLISEKAEAFEDRVPVLGSIPLLGRLFRSEGHRTVKRNLMIFVTATKVAPNGRVLTTRSFE